MGFVRGQKGSPMDTNDRLYTKEPDGAIARWYVYGWYGPNFAVSPVRNAKLRDYKRYYHMDDVGKTIFVTRKEAKESSPAKEESF